VLASAAAFLLSEFADFVVYTPLARRRLVAAVIASSIVGLIVDSIVFLWLAFGSLEFLFGQVIGKLWMVLLAIPFVAWIRRRDERLGLNPVWRSSWRLLSKFFAMLRPAPSPRCC